MDQGDKDLFAKGLEMGRTASTLLVTLATATIAFTATFIEQITSQGFSVLQESSLFIGGWILLAASAVAGFFEIYSS